MKKNLYHVSMSPHWQQDISVPRLMYSFIAALMPATLAGIYRFGVHALLVVVLSMASAVVVEAAMRRIMGREITVRDGNALLIGLLLALMLPPSVPWWLPVVGAGVAIILGKQLFGGLGNNPFHPVAVGWVVLRISWPAHMSKFWAPGSIFSNGWSGWDIAQLPLTLIREDVSEVDAYSLWQLFTGQQPGAIGEVFIIGLLAGGLYLLAKRYITWHAPAGFLATCWIFGLIFYLVDPETYVHPSFHLLTGGIFLGAFFLATDRAGTVPVTPWGMIFFGVGCGLMTMIIRFWGGYTDGVPFGILLMNAMVPLLDRIRPRVYGRVEQSA